MKILGIIPARGGSKGVLRKNIKVLGHKPLLAYTIESALQSKLLTYCLVSTEDAEIAEVAGKSGMPVPFMRPDELALDSTPTIEVVKQIVKTLEDHEMYFNAVMILQPTCPFRTENEIDECIAKFTENETDSLISVKEIPSHFNPHWVFEINEKGTLKIATGEESIITRRQELPKAYIRDGSIYITKTEVLKNQNSLFGKNIGYHLNANLKHVNIDTIQDWEQAEILLKN